MKKILILSSMLISVFLAAQNIYAQEATLDYKKLMVKCSEAVRMAKSYYVTMELKNFFTLNGQANESNSVELRMAFVGPDRFKVEQVINDGSGEHLWDGWLFIGNDYYVFSPAFGWARGEDNNRMAICKNYSPEGIVKQLEGIEKEYKRTSISFGAHEGIEYIIIKYLFGKESINVESLPPVLREGKMSGTCEVWIDKNNYLPLAHSEEVSYYSNEQNQGTSSTNTTYFAYGDEIKIEKPVPGDKIF